MRTSTRTTVAEGIGRTLGHLWLAYKRQDARLVQWMVGKGLSASSAKMTLWGAKLLVLGFLFYVVFWLALFLTFVVVAAWLACNVEHVEDEDKPQWRADDEPDHRQSGFYDPMVHNDDPDPRFKGE